MTQEPASPPQHFSIIALKDIQARQDAQAADFFSQMGEYYMEMVYRSPGEHQTVSLSWLPRHYKIRKEMMERMQASIGKKDSKDGTGHSEPGTP
jgi:hypothetical protein